MHTLNDDVWMIILFDLELLNKCLLFNYFCQRFVRDVLSICVIDMAGSRYMLWQQILKSKMVTSFTIKKYFKLTITFLAHNIEDIAAQIGKY